jgi:Arc/MetJ family transcription regulator
MTPDGMLDWDGETGMRTTLDIDDDVLAAAKELAGTKRKSVGNVISELARTALVRTLSPGRMRNGAPLLPVRRRAKPVTSQLVRQLQED